MSIRLAALVGGWVSTALLIAACVFLWGKWDHAVMQARVDVAAAEKAAAQTLAANEARKSAASDTYAQRTVAMQPIILGSTQKADEYAKTDAGRAPCLAPDRVQSILAARDALFAFTPASGAGSVPAGAPVADAAQQR